MKSSTLYSPCFSTDFQSIAIQRRLSLDKLVLFNEVDYCGASSSKSIAVEVTGVAFFKRRLMASSGLLARVLLLILAVQAKHDGQFTDDDDDKSFSSTLSSSTSSQSPATASSVLSISILTTAAESGPSSNPSTTSVAPTAIPSGALQFSPPGNITMCEPAVFTWEFDASTSVPLTVMVTNERGVSEQIPSLDGAPLVERILTTSVDARVCVVSWPHADVPPGTYTLFATDTTHTGAVSAQSSQFFVTAGSDSSCLNQTSTASASASQTSGSEVSSSVDGSNDMSDTTSPSRGARSLSLGAIIGTVAGILVGVGGLLLVFTLPRLRRRIFRSKAPQRPSGPYILF